MSSAQVPPSFVSPLRLAAVAQSQSKAGSVGAAMPPAATPPAPGPRGPPAALPIILIFALPLLYGLFAGPLFDSAADPDANIPRLNVLVANYDAGFVGQLFVNFWQTYSAKPSWVPNNGALSLTLPGITFINANSSMTRSDLINQVKSGSAWAAMWCNPGTSSYLMAAMSSPALAAVYDPSTAITVAWDEGRNNQVAARIGGATKGLTTAFAFEMTNVVTGMWMGNGKPSDAFTASTLPALASVLATPIYFSELSLYPFTVPALNQALSVGQILLCVFALIIANVVFGPLKLHPVLATAASRACNVPGLDLALRRFGLIVLYSCVIGIAFSTTLVGLAQSHNLTQLQQNLPPGVTYGGINAAGSFGGQIWAQIWATQWALMVIFTLWLAIFAVAAGGPEIAAVFLGPLIIFNAISINVDISDAGFQFFWYAPMWHSAELIRYIMFGTLSSRVGMHVGVHFLWLIVETALFFFVSVRVAAAKLSATEAAVDAVVESVLVDTGLEPVADKGIGDAGTSAAVDDDAAPGPRGRSRGGGGAARV